MFELKIFSAFPLADPILTWTLFTLRNVLTPFQPLSTKKDVYIDVFRGIVNH